MIEDERGIGIDTIADFASQGSAIDVAERGRIELLRGVDIARNTDSEAVDDEVVRAKGIEFDVRKVPADSPQSIDAMLKKAKAELQKAEAENASN